LICMKDSTASMRRLKACHGIVPSCSRARGNVPTMPSTIYILFCILVQLDPISTCPKLPINLLDHLHSCAAYILWFHSLFGNKSGCLRLCLGVNGLMLVPIMLVNSLLVWGFLHLPLQRWEVTSINAAYRKNGSSCLIWRDESQHRLCCSCCSCQGQQQLGGHCLGTKSDFPLYFLNRATHLHLQHQIGRLTIRVPPHPHSFCHLHFCGRFCLACKEEARSLLSAIINLVLLPF
jgi:hypothetical protein